jgi:hypothetical protein
VAFSPDGKRSVSGSNGTRRSKSGIAVALIINTASQWVRQRERKGGEGGVVWLVDVWVNKDTGEKRFSDPGVRFIHSNRSKSGICYHGLSLVQPSKSPNSASFFCSG